jgi:hypothetical protein
MARVLIYTSARKLLAAGRTGFGTVARSRKISNLVVGAIERLSQFDSQRGRDRGRVIFAHRRINVGNTSVHLLSSIRDAGSDYTGRTNHIAHHLLVDPSEAKRLVERGITPADVLLNCEWLSSWESPPKYYEPDDDVDLLGLNTHRGVGTRENWEKLTGNPLHARIITGQNTSKSSVLVFPDSASQLPLMAEATAELDARAWDITFTTLLETSDTLGDFNCILTTSSQLPAIQDRCSSRAILRVDKPDQLPIPNERAVVRPKAQPKRESIVGQAVVSSQQVKTIDEQGSALLGSSTDKKTELSVKLRDLPSGSSDIRGATTKASSARPALPLPAVIGSVAALLIALAVCVLYMSGGKGGTDKDRIAGSNASKGELSPEQTRLRGNLVGLDIDFEDATQIAKAVKDAQCTDWGNYFKELHEFANGSNISWDELTSYKRLGDPPEYPKAKPWWVGELISTSEANKKTLPDLMTLASETDNKALSQSQWRSFSEIAKAYSNKKPFKLDKWKNPFPTLAKDLINKNIRTYKMKEGDFQGILKYTIWSEGTKKKSNPYDKILRDVLIEAVGNAETIDDLANVVKLCGVASTSDREEHEGYKELFDLYTFYNQTAIPLITQKTPKQDKLSKCLDGLKSEYKSKPEFLFKALNLRLPDKGSASHKPPKNPKVAPKNVPSKPTVKRYVYNFSDIKEKGLSSDLITQFLENHKDGEDIKEGWLLKIDGSDAMLRSSGVFLRTGGDFNKPNLQIENGGGKLLLGEADFLMLELSHASQHEYVFINRKRVKLRGSAAVWGTAKFTLHEEGRNLVLKGDLLKRLNELDTRVTVRFWVGDKEWMFKRENNTLLWSGYFPARPGPALKLKKIEEETDEGGATAPRKIIKELVAEYNNEKNKKKPSVRSEKIKRNTKIQGAIKKLHNAIKAALASHLNEQIKQYNNSQTEINIGSFYSMLEDNNHGKLIHFSKYILKQTDPKVADESFHKAMVNKRKVVATSLKSLQVRVSNHDKEMMIILFNGEFESFTPAKNKK